MFTDKVEAKDFAKMPREYQDLLVRVLRIQADCEIGGPHLYAREWLLAAPSDDDQWWVGKIATEEIDHFRKFNRLLNELGFDASERLYVAKQDRYVEAFRQSMPSWADFALFSLLIDRVGKYQLEEFLDCSYAPIGRYLPRILDEEKGHMHFGLMKVQRLMETDEGREQAQAMVDKWYPIGLDMFGRSESPRSERYRYWGLKRRSNAEARAQYQAECAQVLTELGLTVPAETQNRRHL